ncbi:MAG: PEGA domain-containing protein, partial [Methanomicrobiales archaeon]|nr:PEGA domain-containing protein [Methanomicrobiales archaeon]
GIGGDQGYFAITSTPSGAAISFDGSYAGTTPATIPVYTTAQPQHTISLSLEGYQTWVKTYIGNPLAGETIPIHADLVFIPVTQPTHMPGSGTGYYAIASTPTGANVYFDNVYKGLTPVTVPVSPTGTPGHTIRVTLSGYQDWISAYQGNPGDGQIIQVMAYLTPITQYGSVSVDSIPSQATATLDDSSSQITPCTFSNIPPGSHTLMVTKSGYQTWSTVISVIPGKNTHVSATLQALTPDTGSIYATTIPQGASVYVDGVYYGPSPQIASGLSVGTHQVRLSLSGFQDWVGQVEVMGGKTTTLSRTLSVSPTVPPTPVPGTGILAVTSSPAGAQVYLDNVYIGITPITLSSVAGGTHQLLIREQGYADWQATVQVADGQTTPVDATLVPATPAGIPQSPFIAALALGILALAVAGKKR